MQSGERGANWGAEPLELVMGKAETMAELKAELAKLQQENEKLKTRGPASLRCKVGQKGGVSVYGLGRFPVTLYKSQWERLIGFTEDLKAFMAENEGLLKTKE